MAEERESETKGKKRDSERLGWKKKIDGRPLQSLVGDDAEAQSRMAVASLSVFSADLLGPSSSVWVEAPAGFVAFRPFSCGWTRRRWWCGETLLRRRAAVVPGDDDASVEHAGRFVPNDGSSSIRQRQGSKLPLDPTCVP